MSEPYSLTSLLAYAAFLVLPCPQKKFYMYSAQNIAKTHPWPLAWIQVFLFKRCDGILSIGSEQTQVLNVQGYTGSIIEFPLWFEKDHFKPLTPSPDRTTTLQRLANQIVVGYVGSLSEVKGVEDLIEALRISSSLHSSVSLFIYGSGPLKDSLSEQCNTLHAQAIDAQVLGPVSIEDLPALYNCFDILVLPSRTLGHIKEQFGRVVIEAAACGCVTLVSSSGALPETAGNPDWVFEERNPSSLAAVLSRECTRILSESQEQNQKNRLLISTKAVSRFSDQVCAKAFLHYLNRTLDVHGLMNNPNTHVQH